MLGKVREDGGGSKRKYDERPGTPGGLPRVVDLDAGPLLPTTYTVSTEHILVSFMAQKTEVLCQEEPGCTQSLVKLSHCASNLFAKLPVELVERILVDLHTPHVLRAQLVCRAWRRLVQSSLQLQYKLECFLAGVTNSHHNVSGITLSERIRRVRQWKRAWETLQLSEKYDATFPCPALAERSLHVEGSVLGNLDGINGNTFQFYQIGSQTRDTKSKQWAVADVLGSLTYGTWAFSPEEDLLAVLRIYDNENKVDVCFRSCTTGKPHPAAESSAIDITVHAPLVVDETWELDMSICDEFIGIFLYDDNIGRTDIWVFDWKQGKLIWHLFAEADKDTLLPDHFAFLSRDIIIFSAFAQGSSQLIVANLQNADRTSQRFQGLLSWNHCVFLDFPKLSQNCIYQLSTVFVTPARTGTCDGGLFQMRKSNSLVLLMLEIADETGAEHSYDLIISPGFIPGRLEKLPRTPGHDRFVRWRDWAMHTRIFRTFEVPEIPLYGTRYLTAMTVADGKYKLVLRDFGSMSTPKRDATEDADGHRALEEVEDEDGLWSDDIKYTGLLYREVVSDVIVDFEDRVFLAEDGIIIARHNEEPVEASGSTRLEIYSI